jgi:hypothetical protein
VSLGDFENGYSTELDYFGELRWAERANARVGQFGFCLAFLRVRYGIQQGKGPWMSGPEKAKQPA